MDVGREIASVLWPLIVVSAIVLFVLWRLSSKHKRGKLGRKKTKEAQTILASLIPFGMISGAIISIGISFLFPIELITVLSLGAGVGLLFGYFAYEWYGKRE